MIKKQYGLTTLMVFLISAISLVVLVSSLVMYTTSYHSMLIQNTRVTSMQTVAQSTSMVNNYVNNMTEIMDALVENFDEGLIFGDAHMEEGKPLKTEAVGVKEAVGAEAVDVKGIAGAKEVDAKEIAGAKAVNAKEIAGAKAVDAKQTSEDGYEKEKLDEYFNSFLQIRPDVIDVTYYDEEKNMIGCWTINHRVKDKIYQNLSFDEKYQDSSFFISLPHVASIFKQYYPWVVSMGRKTDQGRWLVMDLSFNSISSYINNVGIGQHGYCYMLDREGNLIYHPQQQLINSGLKTEDVSGIAGLDDGTYTIGKQIYTIRSVDNSSWKLVGVSYVDELISDNMNRMTRYAVFLALCILVAAIYSALYFTRKVKEPLESLEESMLEFEEHADQFHYVPVEGTKEINALSKSFSHMVLQIQHLMDTIRKDEVNLRKTELKALQAQINPHFLYNTLDSIAWMCERERNKDAIQMVNALARLFRISISKGHELIPIEKEIEHARSYLEIQKFRYKNQFEYAFHVDPSCLEFLCNKITIQPIIENSINHGFDLLVDKGYMDITVRREAEDIMIIVEDNGIGMEQELVDSMLREEAQDRAGIGIKNVNDRLKIYFGAQYGLRIESELDVGTTVFIRIPAIRGEEYENV